MNFQFLDVTAVCIDLQERQYLAALVIVAMSEFVAGGYCFHADFRKSSW